MLKNNYNTNKHSKAAGPGSVVRHDPGLVAVAPMVMPPCAPAPPTVKPRRTQRAGRANRPP